MVNYGWVCGQIRTFLQVNLTGGGLMETVCQPVMNLNILQTAALEVRRLKDVPMLQGMYKYTVVSVAYLSSNPTLLFIFNYYSDILI